MSTITLVSYHAETKLHRFLIQPKDISNPLYLEATEAQILIFVNERESEFPFPITDADWMALNGWVCECCDQKCKSEDMLNKPVKIEFGAHA